MRATPAGQPRTVRLDSLTGLRWWAAFGVYLFHLANLAPIPYAQAVFDFGNYGVAFFFVLSGFVLTWSARPETRPSTFWWRRFARIYPLHFVTLLLAIPVFYRVDPDPAQWWIKPLDLTVLALSLVLIQGWWTDPRILFSGNPAAWTLTCEAFFYAIHPGVNRAFRVLRTHGALIAIGVILLALLVWRAATLLLPGLSGVPVPLARVGEFLLGIAIATAMRAGWRLRTSPWVGYAGLAAAALILAFAPRLGAIPGAATAIAFLPEVVIALCGFTIAAVATRDLEGGRTGLRSRVMVILGDSSYAFYLIHATVLYLVREVTGFHEASWLNVFWLVGVGAVALALSLALHYGIEKPVERRMRSWWDDRLTRRDAARQPQ